MANYQHQECKDIIILIKAARTEVGIQLKMQGYSVGEDQCLTKSHPKDEHDEERWANIIGQR